MPRNSPPQEFGPLLRKLFREHRREPALTLNQLREHWTAIAGTEMGSRTRPAKLERGTLWVDTPDACWAYELQFFKQDLLNSIQAFIKSSTVTDLRFTVARETLNPASAEGGQGLPAHPPGEPIPVEPIPGESSEVKPTAVKSTAPASPAGAGNPSSFYDSEAQVAEARNTGDQVTGAGQNAGFGEDGWGDGDNDGGDNDGGHNSVRDAFQRMRDRRTRP
ncbi:MAG: DUF721 domain-containing protein [bacterium]